jgi:hypothetical protein
MFMEHFKQCQATPQITDAIATTIDNVLCRLATQGRPSQAADAGWHEALDAVRAALEAALHGGEK